MKLATGLWASLMKHTGEGPVEVDFDVQYQGLQHYGMLYMIMAGIRDRFFRVPFVIETCSP